MSIFEPGNLSPLPGDVATSSKFYAWWLQKARGYQLRHLSRSPAQNWLGQIYYKDTYVLNKENSDRTGQSKR